MKKLKKIVFTIFTPAGLGIRDILLFRLNWLGLPHKYCHNVRYFPKRAQKYRNL